MGNSVKTKQNLCLLESARQHFIQAKDLVERELGVVFCSSQLGGDEIQIYSGIRKLTKALNIEPTYLYRYTEEYDKIYFEYQGLEYFQLEDLDKEEL